MKKVHLAIRFGRWTITNVTEENMYEFNIDYVDIASFWCYMRNTKKLILKGGS